jgi:cytidylate kinase
LPLAANTARGKSTVAKALADQFHLRYVSAGKIFRDLAKERGLSLADFSLTRPDSGLREGHKFYTKCCISLIYQI